MGGFLRVEDRMYSADTSRDARAVRILDNRLIDVAESRFSHRLRALTPSNRWEAGPR